MARSLVKAVRATSRPGSTLSCRPMISARDEGIAMMCLAEALLRIPDAEPPTN